VKTARTNATDVAPVQTIIRLYGNYQTNAVAVGVQLTLNDVETLRNILLKEGLSKVTVARYLSVLRAAGGEHLAHLNIGKLISELKREPTKVECWTKDEVVKIADSVREVGSHSLFYYIQFLFATGMRRGELLALHWEDFDRERQRIHIHRSLALDGSVQNGTKWGGERWFPMGQRHSDLYDMMHLHLSYGESRRMFRLLDQRTVGRNFNRVIAHAGVSKHKMHCTRHTAISWALSSGMSLRKASEIFGVSQATLEKHYAHYVDEEVSMDWANL
jgi:integrase